MSPRKVSVSEAPLSRGRNIEWPTVAVAVAIYSAWLTVTYLFRTFPPLLLFVAGGWLTAWHSSLQHEVIHGHPTPSRRINLFIGAVPISLWLPFELYRRSHLQHHEAESVTEPGRDPESRYLAQRGGLFGRMERMLAAIEGPLVGRLLIGPPLEIIRSLAKDVTAAVRGDRATLRAWAWHAVGAAPLLVWLRCVCHLPLSTYAVFFIYPGTALLLLRSFAEHRAHPLPTRRVAVVEHAPFLGLLFLHNNLHAAHHAWPELAWYRLPRIYRQHRSRLLRDNGGLVYAGYQDVLRRFLLRPHDRRTHAEALAEAEGS
jgi:fatty acid desaturase